MSLLIECATERHSKNLLKSKTLCNILVNVTPHTTLNFRKGVVRYKDLEGVSEEEICANWIRAVPGPFQHRDLVFLLELNDNL